MANPSYQPPFSRSAAVRPEGVVRASPFGGRMMRAVRNLARSLRLPRLPGRHGCVRHDGAPNAPSGRDVLWRAKCNALHRALADHDLTAPQVRVILCRLSAVRGHGCELRRLQLLTGVDAGILDKAVPLLGLQNFITVRETDPEGSSGPVLWVSATEHGLRYAAEDFAASAFGPRVATSEERA